MEIEEVGFFWQINNILREFGPMSVWQHRLSSIRTIQKSLAAAITIWLNFQKNEQKEREREGKKKWVESSLTKLLSCFTSLTR